MASSKAFLLFFFIIYVLCKCSLGSVHGETENADTKVYIVYMGATPKDNSLLSDHHLRLLQEVVENRNAEEALVRSYKRSLNGFAAKLTEKEAQNLKNMKEIVSVFPSRTLQPQTTRSWDFMGFTETAHGLQSAESDIILGVIDSGIWPESPSFSDKGLGPAPKKWKGVCEGGQNFTCNNKIIGARTYSESKTARDSLGHGSHTASTAAGRKVSDVSFYGIAKGSARGGAPTARIAVYKVCDIDGCSESDILAAFDDAISDGVDLITISLGSSSGVDMYTDVIAIGAFHGAEKRVLTVHSAGNSGLSGTVSSVAPWLFTVAASTLDRRIYAKVTLGDGRILLGNAVNSFTLKGDKFPVVYGKQASSQCDEESARQCWDGCLDRSLVKGKIVVCDEMRLSEALRVGALGFLGRTHIEDVSFVLPMPAAGLIPHDYDILLSYINSTKDPEANIFKSESIKDPTAPVVASFSSRGPNTIASDILKPDISAPGLDILAAYSPIASVSPGDKRSVKYSILSGTSMSCPHVAGVAAYLKSLHCDWSPAAIKSALMTTAHPMSPSKNTDGEFAYGSGHVNPVKVANPGLVYDTQKDDYITFMCNLGYDEDQIRRVSGDRSSSCSKKIDSTSSPRDVNYPSMSVMVEAGTPFSVKFQRRVTNVGTANSTYVAKVESGSKIKVTVEPKSLSFKSLKEEKSFEVTVTGDDIILNGPPVSASLTWSDGVHSVRSPVVVYAYSG